MSRSVHRPSRRRLPALLLPALALHLAALGALAGDLKLEAELIWGANAAPATVNNTLADPKLAATLRRNNFKWTNYYLITNLTASIPLNQTRDLRMSDRCTLVIRNLGSSRVAVDFMGQGRQVSKGTNTLPCIYSGAKADDTAWFITLRSLDDKK
jgi:hypothetical protein